MTEYKKYLRKAVSWKLDISQTKTKTNIKKKQTHTNLLL